MTSHPIAVNMHMSKDEAAETMRKHKLHHLLVTDDEVLIVDYKSNRPPPTTAEATPVPYLAQMAVYRDLAVQAFPGRTIKAALLWTEAPRLVILPDSLIAPHSLA